MAHAQHGHGLGAHITAQRVLVVAHEPTDSLLNTNKQALRFLCNFWQLVSRHGINSKSQKLLTGAHRANTRVVVAGAGAVDKAVAEEHNPNSSVIPGAWSAGPVTVALGVREFLSVDCRAVARQVQQRFQFLAGWHAPSFTKIANGFFGFFVGNVGAIQECFAPFQIGIFRCGFQGLGLHYLLRLKMGSVQAARDGYF
jgi:hypothetical protein